MPEMLFSLATNVIPPLAPPDLCLNIKALSIPFIDLLSILGCDFFILETG